MFKRDINILDLNQPIDQLEYISVLNSIQDELCAVIEASGQKVTQDNDSSMNQLQQALSQLSIAPKSVDLSLASEESRFMEDKIIRFDSIQLDPTKVSLASFILSYEYVQAWTRYIERFYLTYSHRLKRWHFLIPSTFNHCHPRDNVHYDSLTLDTSGFIPQRGPVQFVPETYTYIIKADPKYPQVTFRAGPSTKIKETVFFFDESGTACLALAKPIFDPFTMFKLYDFRIIA